MRHKTPSLVELYRAQGEGWRAFIGAAERGESWEAPGVSVGIGGEVSEDVNRVVVYGPEGVADGIAMAASVLRRRGLPGTVYAASTVAGEAGEVAQALGFLHAGHLLLMCAHGSDVVRACDGHETCRVTDMEGILSAGDILADACRLPVDWCQRLLGVGFARLPDATAYLALHDGRPVAVAGAALTGDIAGVYGVATRSTHRRRGAGGCAMSAAVDHQLRAGARWFGLLSTQEAEPFYAGLGFVTVDHPDVWVLRPE